MPGGRAEPVILAREASRACDSNGGPSPGVAVVEPELGLPLSPGIATANGTDASGLSYLAGSGFSAKG